VNRPPHECKRERPISSTGKILLSECLNRSRVRKNDPLPPRLPARARILRCSARVQVDVITQYFNILLDERQLRPAN
jgi:hypothetical protein